MMSIHLKQYAKILPAIITIIFVSLTGFTDGIKGCKIMHRGVFLYSGVTKNVKVVIDGTNHTEFHENGKYFIKSKLTWVSDCEYNMTMAEITLPDFPFKPGDIMNVKINKIDGKEIYYTSTVQGKSWDGKFIKIKDQP